MVEFPFITWKQIFVIVLHGAPIIDTTVLFVCLYFDAFSLIIMLTMLACLCWELLGLCE